MSLDRMSCIREVTTGAGDERRGEDAMALARRRSELHFRHGVNSGSHPLALAGFASALCLHSNGTANRLLVDPAKIDEDFAEQLVSSAGVLE